MFQKWRLRCTKVRRIDATGEPGWTRQRAESAFRTQYTESLLWQSFLPVVYCHFVPHRTVHVNDEQHEADALNGREISRLRRLSVRAIAVFCPRFGNTDEGSFELSQAIRISLGIRWP